MTLTGVLDQLNQAMDGERVSLGQLVAALNQRGFGPLLLAPALIAILPTGAIPGVPTLCAVTIALTAGQLAAGRRMPWLPAWLQRREIDRVRFSRAFDAARPVTYRLDRFIRPRLAIMVREPVPRLLALLCCALAVLMIPLELVPLAAAMPAAAIALMGVGLGARDGLLIVFGLAAAAGAVTASAWLWI